MSASNVTYSRTGAPPSKLDSRVKIVLLAAYSVAVFLIESWVGMALCVLALACALVAGRVKPRALAAPLVPVGVLACMTILFGALRAASSPAGAPVPLLPWYQLFPDAAAEAALICGPVVLSLSGALTGLFLATRIVALALASFAVCFTTPSTELVFGFSSLLSPLRALHVPVDDIATVLSLALRFIPQMADDFQDIRTCQIARGAPLDVGGAFERIRAYGAVFAPFFVRLYRHADAVAVAMAARCYGAAKRTALPQATSKGLSVAVLVCGLAALAALAVAL